MILFDLSVVQILISLTCKLPRKVVILFKVIPFPILILNVNYIIGLIEILSVCVCEGESDVFSA
jgi:hypothetical protein